jgi:hypothetical protein
MANTTEREREILHEHPHEQELVHHAPGWTGIPTTLAVMLFMGAVAIASLLVVMIALG